MIRIILTIILLSGCNLNNDPNNLQKKIQELNSTEITDIIVKEFVIDEIIVDSSYEIFSNTEKTRLIDSLKLALAENSHLTVDTKDVKTQIALDIRIDGWNRFTIYAGVHRNGRDFIIASENLKSLGVEHRKSVFSNKLSYIYGK